MRKRLAHVLTAAGFFCLIVALLLSIVEWIGTDATLYRRLQRKNGVTAAIGVSDDDLFRLDAALARYLKGDEAALDVEAEVYGARQPAFHEWEIRHMADVLFLFRLLRTVRTVLAPTGAALLLIGLGLGRRDCARRWGRLYALALALLLVPLGAFALWAARDFDAAFIAFHQALFTNDLWLLDPDTDLLIRMLPEGFFADMAGRIALWAAAWLVTAGALAALAGRLIAARPPRKTRAAR